MAKRGRPKVLDETKKGTIAAIVAVGGSRAMAADYVGCSARTIRRECRADRAFHESLRQRESGCELHYLRSVRTAAEESRNWRAAAWALERLFPVRYTRRVPRAVKNPELRRIIDRLVQTVLDATPDPNLRIALLDYVRAITSVANEANLD